MLYKDVLSKIQRMGFDEVGRWKIDDLEKASIASSRVNIVIPYAFPNYPVTLENGDDSDIDDEVVDALMRWIKRQIQ